MFAREHRRSLAQPAMRRRPEFASASNPEAALVQSRKVCPCGGGCPRCVADRDSSAAQDPLRIQRKCACDGEGICEHCQSQREDTPRVQTKVPVGPVDDPRELEADRLAERAMHMQGAAVLIPAQTSIQRSFGAREADDLENGGNQVQRESAGVAGADLSLTSSELANGGTPLAGPVREFFESRFDRDFSAVRTHADKTSGDANAGLRSHAFTYGSHIWLGAGQTASTNLLMAHELAHVVQQTAPRSRGRAAASPTVSQSPAAIQRDSKAGTPEEGGDCPTNIPPGYASANYDDHSQGRSGSYYIYCPPYRGESPSDLAGKTIDAWLVWRFNGLSPAMSTRVRDEAAKGGWKWTSDKPPTDGCQAMVAMSMDLASRLVRLAGYDVEARKQEKREKKAGLPDTASLGDDLHIVNKRPGGGSAALSREEAEAALDPTNVYNQGAKGANYPAFPMSLEGPEMEVPKGFGTYTSRIRYEDVTSDPAMLLAYSMNAVTHYWELFDITDMLMRGMGMGNTMLEEAKQTQEVAQNLKPNATAAKAADQAAPQRKRNDVQQISEEAKDALRELRDPVKATAHGSAIDVVTRAYANFLNLELLPASALKAVGGWLIDAFWEAFGGHLKEREIAFPEKEGFYMVRCIAQPGPRGPDHSERRAASVRAVIVEVRRPEILARNAMGLADAAIARIELQQAMTSDPKELARLEKQKGDIQEQSSGDIVSYLTRLIAEKQTEKDAAPPWRVRELERELNSLELRLSQAKGKREGTGQIHIRPQVAFTSTITGETYPLMIELSPIPVLDDEGNEAPNRKKVRLFDVTVPDREKIDREGSTLEQAVDNAFEIFRKNGDLGPGLLFVRMPPDWKGKREFTLRVSATGGALVKKRLEDLAEVLMVLSVLVPGAGEISVAIGAGLAAERLISRAFNHTLRLDDAAISDTIAILGAIAQGAQLVGKLRIGVKGDAFVGALRSAEQGAVERAAAELAAAMKTANILSATSTVVNAGGLIWGDYSMIKGYADIEEQEMNGAISHSEAERMRAHMLTNAIVQHGLMLHGMLEPQGADRTTGEAAKTETPPVDAPPGETRVPRPGENTQGTHTPEARKAEGPPETFSETELEKRANESAKAGPESQPAAKKDNVRARFSTPDNLHEIFILEDGRIFRCSLTCTELRQWYDPYLTRQKPGSRRDLAMELSERLEVLERRSNGGEKSTDLDRAIGALDVAMREFIAPDLARELQHGAEAHKLIGPGETYLTKDEVGRLLRYFNLDEIARLTGPDGPGSAEAVRSLATALEGLDKFLTPADRETLRPVLARIAEGGSGAAIDFLGRIAGIHEVQGVTFDLAELIKAFENGDAILVHGPLQTGIFLENEFDLYELEGGRLKIGGKEGAIPKGLKKAPWNRAIDFVLLRKGGNFRLVLGLEHSGLSGGASSVFGAGRLIIDDNGYVVRVSRQSGHYRPSVANLRRAAQFMINNGILLDPVVAKTLNRPAVEVNTDF
jgi:Domain of unknown function (DUF4157)